MNMKIIFGPNSYALTDWMEQYDGPMIRVWGSTEPEPRENARDIHMQELPGVLRDLSLTGRTELDVIAAAVVSQSSLMVTDFTEQVQLHTNVNEYVRLTMTCLPIMIRAKYGRFVYLSSFRSVSPTKGAVLYGACKAFGEALFAGIGVEYESRNIRTASLRLGYLDGGLVGPRPEGITPVTPKQITASIEYAMHVMETQSTMIDLSWGHHG